VLEAKLVKSNKIWDMSQGRGGKICWQSNSVGGIGNKIPRETK
jgi:hypothetical protein